MTSGRDGQFSAGAIPHSFTGGAHRGNECRTTLLALKSWTNIRKDDGIPDLAALTSMANKAGKREVFTENHFLIRIDPASENSVVIFYGDGLPNPPGRRIEGKSLRHCLPAVLRDIFQDACMEAAGHGDVVYRQGEISTLSGARVLYRCIFMPLRSEGHPDHVYIFGAFSNEAGGGERLAAA